MKSTFEDMFDSRDHSYTTIYVENLRLRVPVSIRAEIDSSEPRLWGFLLEARQHACLKKAYRAIVESEVVTEAVINKIDEHLARKEPLGGSRNHGRGGTIRLLDGIGVAIRRLDLAVRSIARAFEEPPPRKHNPKSWVKL